MQPACLLIGFTVIAVALWLEYNDYLGWPNEADRERGGTTDRDTRYRLLRRRWRRVVHLLIALCGALMASTGFSGPGRFFIAAWTAVAMLMMVVIVLALGDAFRTHRYYAAKRRPGHSSPPGDDAVA
jgi:hypothetical protein